MSDKFLSLGDIYVTHAVVVLKDALVKSQLSLYYTIPPNLGLHCQNTSDGTEQQDERGDIWRVGRAEKWRSRQQTADDRRRSTTKTVDEHAGHRACAPHNVQHTDTVQDL